MKMELVLCDLKAVFNVMNTKEINYTLKSLGFDSHVGYAPLDRATTPKNPIFSSSVNNIANIFLVFWKSDCFPPNFALHCNNEVPTHFL